MITDNKKHSVGLFGIGLQAYWAQFEGLEARLTGFLNLVESNVKTGGVNVINAGLVDTVEKAFDAGDLFKREDVSLIFLYVSTYALSATVLPVVKKAGVTVIVLNLSPAASLDYKWFNNLNNRTRMTGEWLAFCSACPVPEIANVFNRGGIAFHQITGTIDDEMVWQEVHEWVDAARVTSAMYYNRLGVMGNYYGGMLDIYTDLTLQLTTFGGHIEIIEVDELSSLRRDATDGEIEDKVAEIHQEFDVQNDCSPLEVRRAAQTAVALDKLVAIHKLGSLAYYHKGTGNDNANTMSSVILGNSLLTGKHIPVAGEYEIKNVQAMKIMDLLGAGGSFTEYYAMDFADDVVLMGHDGPCHPRIAEGKIKVKPLQVYHGKVGDGLSVEMSVSHGEVTLLSVVETGKGGIKLLVAHGRSVAGDILEIGNTNSRYEFECGARKFVEGWNAHGPAHHCAVGKGHIASAIRKIAAILKIECIQIC
jgi:L-arabinose isomerase